MKQLTPFLDYSNQQILLNLVCRPALPMDTAGVLHLTSLTWEGEDYFPYVWEEWLADPKGLLVVTEYGGEILGLGKLTYLSPDEWWMEGLRVHPKYERQGIATHVHNFLLNHWINNYTGVLRLATSSTRIPVHRICHKSGFTQIAEFTIYIANTISQPVTSFNPVSDADSIIAYNIAMRNEVFSLSYDLINIGWRWARPNITYLKEAIKSGKAWWWGDKQGLLTILEDDEKGEIFPILQIVACPLEDMVTMLHDYLCYAYQTGYKKVAWLASLQPDLGTLMFLVLIMQSAGFNRDWEAELLIFEKPHPAMGHECPMV